MHPLNVQLNCLGDCVSKLIESSSEAIHLKDAHTGKYIEGNFRMIEIIGLRKKEDIVGLTVEDVMAEEGPLKIDFCQDALDWRIKQVQKFKNLDNQVKNRNQCIELQHVFFTHEGHLLIERTKRFPVFDIGRKKVIATLSVSRDITLQQNLVSLLNLYKGYFSEKYAIQKILDFLGIESFFSKQPTYTEMKVLFAMRQNSHRKYLSKLLKLSDDTIASHIYHIRKSKLKVPDLNRVLIKLRALPVNENGMYGYA